MSPLAVNLVATAAAVLVLMAAAAAVGTWVRAGRHDGVDVVWGGGFALVAVVTLALSAGHSEPWRRWLVTGLTAVWGLRLAWHIARRARGHPEDPRYRRMLVKAPGNRDRYALRMVYLPQAVLLWLVSLPVQLAQYGFGANPATTGLGVALWVLGLTFETVGDHQLARFRADPANSGRVLDTGLWRYTRHPNYFGDACVWWGLALLGLHRPLGLLGLLSAALMTLLLTRVSGARLLESTIGQRRDGYADYVSRTSGFVPLPPGEPPLASRTDPMMIETRRTTVAANPGDQVTDFELADETGTPRRLSALTENGPVVLFFYPMASSSGCTKEACHFRDLAGEFAAVGAQPVGISPDAVDKQRKFAGNHSLGYPLLSDEGGAVAKELGAWRKLLPLHTKRLTFVIGPDRRIIDVIKGEMQFDRHADEALRILREHRAAA